MAFIIRLPGESKTQQNIPQKTNYERWLEQFGDGTEIRPASPEESRRAGFDKEISISDRLKNQQQALEELGYVPNLKIKIPFVKKNIPGVTLPGGSQADKSGAIVKGLFEFPEFAVKSIAQTPGVLGRKLLGKDVIGGLNLERLKPQEPRVQSLFETQVLHQEELIEQGGPESTARWAAGLQAGGEAIFAVTFVGDLVGAGVKSLATKGAVAADSQVAAWELMGRPKNKTQLKANYRKSAHVLHPDKGGSQLAFSKLNEANQILNKTGIPSRAAILRNKAIYETSFTPINKSTTGKIFTRPKPEVAPSVTLEKGLPGVRPKGGVKQPRVGLAIEEVETVGRTLPKTKPPKIMGVDPVAKITKAEDVLLRNTIRAMSRSSKTAKKVEQAVARRQVQLMNREKSRALEQAQRQAKNDIVQTKAIERQKASDMVAEVKFAKDLTAKLDKQFLKQRQEAALKITDRLPSDIQGRYRKAIVEATTPKRVVKLATRVANKIQEAEARSIVKEATTLEKTAKTAKITTDYQRTINNLLADYNFRTPTEKTMKRLKATHQFLKQNPDYPIPNKYVAELDKLQRKNIREMKPADVQKLNETIRHLIDLGKEIQKHRVLSNKLKFQNEVDRAVKSVKNLDYENNTLNNLVKSYNAFEFRHRVADKSDGTQFYKGWHAEMVKQAGQKFNIADINQSTRLNSFFQEHLNISNVTLDEVGQKRVAAHLYHDQGGTIQSNKILKDLKLDELPSLTPTEMEVKNLLIKYVGEKTKDIQILWETTMVDDAGRPMLFEIQENYFPFSYEQQGADIGLNTVLQDYKKQSKLTFGQGFSRLEEVRLTPRTDVYKMLQEAIAQQEIFLNLQPLLLEKGAIFRTAEYRKAAGNFNVEYWTDYVDTLSRNGTSSNALRTSIDGILRKGRQNISRGLLDLSITSTMIQPFAILDAMGYAITHVSPKVAGSMAINLVTSFIKPNLTRNTIERSLALQTRKGGEEVISSFSDKRMKKGIKIPSTPTEKAIKAITSPFAALQYLDMKTAAAVQRAVYNDFKKFMPDELAQQEADFIMDMVSSTSNIAYRPDIMAKGEMAKAVTTFQSFVLNEWGLITQDMIKKGLYRGGVNNSIKGRFLALIGMSLFVLQAYLEDKARTKLTNLVKGTDYESDSFITSALLYLPERIPVLGNIVSGMKYNKKGLRVPVIDTFTNILSGTVGTITAKEDKTKLVNLTKAVESFAQLFGGVPGSKDVQNLVERAINASEIGEESLEDVKKRVQEGLDSGELTPEIGLKIIEEFEKKQKDKIQREKFKLSPEEYNKDLEQRLASGEITPEDAVKEADKYDKQREDAEGEEFIDDGTGLYKSGDPYDKTKTEFVRDWVKVWGVDAPNAFRALVTDEKLGKVKGNLAEMQRFKGIDFTAEGGSQKKKKELLKELGIPWSDREDYKLEHIVPVKAGGSTSDKNLKIITTEEWESYIPVDLLASRKIQAGQIKRKNVEDIMKRLKVEKSITVDEALEILSKF